MTVLKNIKDLLISPRFIAFYWSIGITAVIDFIDIIIPAIPDLGLPQWIAVLTVAGLAQITKALNNLQKGKPMGFAPPK